MLNTWATPQEWTMTWTTPWATKEEEKENKKQCHATNNVKVKLQKMWKQATTQSKIKKEGKEDKVVPNKNVHAFYST